MLTTIFTEYKDLGLVPIPLEWDAVNKQPVGHIKGWAELTPASDLKPPNNAHNGLMIKTYGHWGCFDFDLKNTEKKQLFEEWLTIIKHAHPDILNKVFIEKTRSGGYHVWILYNHLPKKTALADGPAGQEVIAIYANGPLVYTYPTPGYSEYLNSMADVQPLTKDEFQILVETSQYFNEYKPNYDPSSKAANYPAGHEKTLIAFDNLLPQEIFAQILADIGLVQCDQQPRDKPFVAYRRAESTSSSIGAKVYFSSKRVLLFTASMPDYPNWHNKEDFEIWSMPPSFILFYKLGRDWGKTIDYINTIIDSAGIDLSAEFDMGFVSDYPLHVFPDPIRQSIIDVCESRSLSPGFVATSGLWTISSLSGTRYVSDFGEEGKNILYCLMVAPISVGKTPAFRVMCESVLKNAYDANDKQFEEKLKGWNKKKAQAFHDKKPFTDIKPRSFIPIAVDGTTEGYISKSMIQPLGIGVYQDEAETIFNAGSFKGTNDSISFFTQAFSGGRITQIRADEEKERRVPNLNINLLMGTQPTRLQNIFTQDRLAAGFPSRFLMVESDYRELNVNADPFGSKKQMCKEWSDTVEYLYHTGNEFNQGNGLPCFIPMTDAAKGLYRAYYRTILTEANQRIKSKAEGFIIGTEAKMSAYLPRLVQVLAIMSSPQAPIITDAIVRNGWDLYRYYAASTLKIIGKLYQEIETGLPTELDLLYNALPPAFTNKEAEEACKLINLKARKFRDSLRRKDFGALFRRTDKGGYCKI